MTKKAECPNVKNHTSCPAGYIEWHEWAQDKSRRHKQIICPGCGLFAIWIRRDKDEPDFGGHEELMLMASDYK